MIVLRTLANSVFQAFMAIVPPIVYLLTENLELHHLEPRSDISDSIMKLTTCG